MRLCSLHADFAVVFTPQAKYTNIRRKHRQKRTPLLTATSRSPPTEGTANLVVSCQEYARTSVRSYHRSTLVRRPVSLAIYARPVRQDKLSQQSVFSLSCGSVFAANQFLRYLVSNLVVIFTEDGVSGAPNGWEPVVVCHCMTLAVLDPVADRRILEKQKKSSVFVPTEKVVRDGYGSLRGHVYSPSSSLNI